MFIVKCTNCGREQKWTTGVTVGEASIQVAGFSVYYSCGTIVTEVDDLLREITIKVDDPSTF